MTAAERKAKADARKAAIRARDIRLKAENARQLAEIRKRRAGRDEGKRKMLAAAEKRLREKAAKLK